MNVPPQASPSHDARPPTHAARQAAATAPRPDGRSERAPAEAFAQLLQGLSEDALAGGEPSPEFGDDRTDAAADRDAEAAGLPPATPLAVTPPALPPQGMDLVARADAAASAKGFASATELLQATLGVGAPGPRGRGPQEAPGKAGVASLASLRADLPMRHATSVDTSDNIGAALQAAPGGLPQPLPAPLAASLEGGARPMPAIGAEPAFVLKEPRPLDAPAAPLQAELRASPGHASFADELSTQVQLMLDGGLDSAELRMNPAELGPVRISLNVNEQTADIRFEAAHASTREGIERSLSELREMLAQEGLSLGQAHVGQGGDHRGLGQQRESPAPPSGGGSPGHQGRGTAGVDDAAATPRPRVLRGTLDLYA